LKCELQGSNWCLEEAPGAHEKGRIVKRSALSLAPVAPCWLRLEGQAKRKLDESGVIDLARDDAKLRIP
jgi:hypothetical protein